MRIFSSRKRKQEEQADLRIVQTDEKISYDFFAVLAKALLVFMLVYGSLGGFLSAYKVEYNKSLCMMAVFFLSLIFGAVYETRKRWATNLLNIVVFLLYLFASVRTFWLVNSGCYAVLNKVLEEARIYLGLTSGTEYILVVDDDYTTVTVFVLFIGVVGTILLNIHLQQKASIFKVVFLTLPFYVFPFYFEKTPDSIYILFLLTGYVTVTVLQCCNVKDRISAQMRYVLPVAAILVVIIVQLTGFLLPQRRYELYMPANLSKKSSEKGMMNLVQYGVMAFFMQKSGAGMSGGYLSNGAAVMPDYETDLIVRFTPYNYQPVYLKAFTGKKYTRNRWTAAREEQPDDSRMEASVIGRREAWQRGEEKQARGIMEVENVGASELYEYLPYYTDPDLVEENEHGKVYTYYPAVGKVTSVRELVDEDYLEVPDSCLRAVKSVCEDAGFSGTPEEIAVQVKKYFQQNYSYTLRPGYTFGNPDFITYFLMSSKKGYCAHFASAGTMLFRYMGIPARYVEGYAFSYTEIVGDGELVQDASYEDYYSGYSPIGETGLIELEVPDASAHGWVEIYIDGSGWVVVDPTPAAMGDEDDRTSFWDAFRFQSGDEGAGGFELGRGNFGELLEKGIGRTASLFLLVAVAAMVLFFGKTLVRRILESRLPGKQRVQLEYRRLTGRVGKRSKEFAALRTIREQMDWLEYAYGVEVPKALTDRLYIVFFASEGEQKEWEDVREALEKLRRKIWFKREKAVKH